VDGMLNKRSSIGIKENFQNDKVPSYVRYPFQELALLGNIANNLILDVKRMNFLLCIGILFRI